MAARLIAIFWLLPMLLQAQVAPPRLIHSVEPIYPPMARTMRIAGTVRLAVAIDDDGTVAAIKLISGHPLLVQAAMDVVAQRRYSPALRLGRPVRFVIEARIGFRLAEPAEIESHV